MGSRILKDSICTSGTIDQLSAEEERCFTRLLTQCDDYGRFHAHPGIVQGHCFPRKHDLSLATIADWMDALQRVGLILIYEADGEHYLQVVTWEKHQQVRAKKSKYPEPPADAPAPEPDRNGMPTWAAAADDEEDLQAVDINRNHLPADEINGSQLISSRARAESNPIQSESNTPATQVVSIARACEEGFDQDEQDRVNGVMRAFSAYPEFQPKPDFWRKVLDTYGSFDLEAEALKCRNWLRLNKKRTLSDRRYLNWLEKAQEIRERRGVVALPIRGKPRQEEEPFSTGRRFVSDDGDDPVVAVEAF